MLCVALKALAGVFVMKYRVKFAKVGKVCFIGHLDLLKVFQRAIKRAGIPIAYSNGFNPHQIVGFAIPLPLGMSSIGEYVDVELKEEVAPEIIALKLNEVMPDGIQILSVRKLNQNEKSCAAVVSAALYEISLPIYIENFSDIIEKILSRDKLEIERISKRKTKIVDIKNDIFSVENIIKDCDFTVFRTIVSTGSRKNLKPELFVEYINNYIGKKFEPLKVRYKRIELFKDNGGVFFAL